MKDNLKPICFGAVMLGMLYIGSYYAERDGAADGISHCYANDKEEPASDCQTRAEEFKEKYGHAFDD